MSAASRQWRGGSAGRGREDDDVGGRKWRGIEGRRRKEILPVSYDEVKGGGRNGRVQEGRGQ